MKVLVLPPGDKNMQESVRVCLYVVGGNIVGWWCWFAFMVMTDEWWVEWVKNSSGLSSRNR